MHNILRQLRKNAALNREMVRSLHESLPRRFADDALVRPPRVPDLFPHVENLSGEPDNILEDSLAAVASIGESQAEQTAILRAMLDGTKGNNRRWKITTGIAIAAILVGVIGILV